jgi:tRNA(Glu) U13 pseudouridine synthase TruD
MTVSAHTKKKQAIVFGRRIEDSTRAAEMKPCSVYVSSGRKYVWDRILSDRCSEYYRKQVSCDSLSDE